MPIPVATSCLLSVLFVTMQFIDLYFFCYKWILQFLWSLFPVVSSTEKCSSSQSVSQARCFLERQAMDEGVQKEINRQGQYKTYFESWKEFCAPKNSKSHFIPSFSLIIIAGHKSTLVSPRVSSRYFASMCCEAIFSFQFPSLLF